MEPFQYDTLDNSKDQLRLLRLLPRGEATPISCLLQTFDRGACPEYEALSYTWGPASELEVIVVNGKTLTIRRNLWSFLDLASRHTITRAGNKTAAYLPRYLWIDQITINQFSVVEKNHQVQHIAQVFEGAERVVIWLGASDAHEGLLESIANSTSRDSSHHPQSPESEEDELRNLVLLFSRPYWSRLWIVQEILLARAAIICYGNWYLPWDDLYKCRVLPKILHTESDWSPSCQALLSHITFAVRRILVRRQSEYFMSAADSFSTVVAFTPLACEDPRDKLYGLVALLNLGDEIVVDYAKPAPDVFWDFVRVLFPDAKRPSSDTDTDPRVRRFPWLLQLGIAMGGVKDIPE